MSGVDTALSRSARSSAALRFIGEEGSEFRHKDDFYPTPPDATEALLGVERFNGAIWEPACGDGAISKVLEAAGYAVVSSDLIDRGYGETGIDFLMEWQSRAPNACTNPPFKLAVPFVRKALALTTGKVAFLARINFLEGSERATMFAETPLARVWCFSKRITFQRGGGEVTHGGGMMAFAWFVWEHGHRGRPVLGWLPDRHYDAEADFYRSCDVARAALHAELESRRANGEPELTAEQMIAERRARG